MGVQQMIGNDHGTRRAARPRYSFRYGRAIAIFTVLLGMGMLSRNSSHAAPPQSVDVPLSSGSVKIRFRHCPSSPVPVKTGDPRDDTQPLFNTPKMGYYLSETEITQEQFAAVLGRSRLEQLKARANKRKDAGFPEYFRDARYPVFLVTPYEAEEFCAELTNLSSSGDQILTQRFRLPNTFEWQYACRAGSEKELPHFNRWPEWETIKNIPIATGASGSMGKVSLEKACNDLFKDVLGGPFSGSQDELVRALTELDRKGKSRDAIDILRVFLEKGAGIRIAPDERPQPAYDARGPTGLPNRWNFYYMHSNVSEWVVIEEARSPKSRTWGRAGADFTVTDDWKRFLIWEVREEKNIPDRTNVKELEDLAINRQCGFRVLMETTLAEDWLNRVRDLAFNNLTPEARGRLTALREELPQWVSDAETERVRMRIDYYRAINELRRANRGEALRILGPNWTTLSNEDRYFEHWRTILSEDASL